MSRVITPSAMLFAVGACPGFEKTAVVGRYARQRRDDQRRYRQGELRDEIPGVFRTTISNDLVRD